MSEPLPHSGTGKPRTKVSFPFIHSDPRPREKEASDRIQFSDKWDRQGKGQERHALERERDSTGEERHRYHERPVLPTREASSEENAPPEGAPEGKEGQRITHKEREEQPAAAGQGEGPKAASGESKLPPQKGPADGSGFKGPATSSHPEPKPPSYDYEGKEQDRKTRKEAIEKAFGPAQWTVEARRTTAGLVSYHEVMEKAKASLKEWEGKNSKRGPPGSGDLPPGGSLSPTVDSRGSGDTHKDTSPGKIPGSTDSGTVENRAVATSDLPASYGDSGDEAGDEYGETWDPSGGETGNFGDAGDPFAGTGESYGESGDPFGGDAGTYGDSTDPFGGDAGTYGDSVDPFGGVSESYGFSGDPFVGSEIPVYTEGSAPAGDSTDSGPFGPTGMSG